MTKLQNHLSRDAYKPTIKMILLKRTNEMTNAVQTYKVSGKTTCRFTLKINVCVCYVEDSPAEEMKLKDIEDLSVKTFEKNWGVKIEKITVLKHNRLMIQFADCDEKNMIEQTVKFYLSENNATQAVTEKTSAA